MKNGKHKANSFDSFNSWSKITTPLTPRQARLILKTSVSGVSGVSSVPHPYSLPFREGPGVGFSPRERLTSTKHTAWGGDDEGEGKQCARGG